MNSPRLLCALGLALLTVALNPAAAQARDAVITSFDGTKLNTHFFPAPGLQAGQRAPVVMLVHGFGETGPASPDAARLVGAPKVSELLQAGYNVFTWDARGHGASGGTAMLDSPDFEVRDTRLMIDWIAGQPEVLLDAPGDPRLGMTGASYGGIIQYLTAALDQRVDVITPAYTAYSLRTTTLERNTKFKEGWAAGLAGIGVANLPPGLTSPLGPSLHTLDPDAIAGMLTSVAQGATTKAFGSYLDYRSPSTYLSKVRIPTLVQGGTSDTLFPLINAVSDFRTLKAQRVPVKMSWNCEGHSLCPGDAGPVNEHFDTVVINWFDRWLKRQPSVSTGPQFTWIADNENSYRTAPAFPPKVTGHLTGTGSGSLAITPTAPASSLGFLFIGAQPALGVAAVQVPIAPPASASNVVGFPRLHLTNQGIAAPAKTWIYAQILDQQTNRIVGVQVAPVPVELDGIQHTVDIELEAIATRSDPSSRYLLQLIPGSLIYGTQRSAGTVNLRNISVSLPVAG